MTTEQYYKNLTPPEGMIDVILDTDAFNEIDDQFAISYMVLQPEKFNIRGLCAAPFFNVNADSVADGMERSFWEIQKLLTLMGKADKNTMVYRGSKTYLPDENTPVSSPAASFMAKLADEYSPEKPLYIVAIGAITNVASAILQNPRMKENCVLVWLGGHATHIPDAASEFNMVQDIAAARVVFGCGIPLVQLPCQGVVDIFATTRYELEHWLLGKNKLCDYLCENTIAAAESYAKGKPWSRVIWDVTAVAWLLNREECFMSDYRIPSPIPEYDHTYGSNARRHMICYVYKIYRDNLYEDMIRVLERAE